MSENSDGSLLETLVIYCQEGQIFYQKMEKQVASLAVSSLLRELACVRARALASLDDGGVTDGRQPAVVGTPVSTILDVYAGLAESGDAPFASDSLSQLNRLETNVLNWFGEGVRQLSDRVLADKMATQIASLRVAHDGFKDLRFVF